MLPSSIFGGTYSLSICIYFLLAALLYELEPGLSACLGDVLDLYCLIVGCYCLIVNLLVCLRVTYLIIIYIKYFFCHAPFRLKSTPACLCDVFDKCLYVIT